MSSDLSPLPLLSTGQGKFAIRFLRRSRARRYTLRIHSENELRVTLPHRAPLHQAWEFVETCREWLESQLQIRSENRWREGSPVLFRGRSVLLEIKVENEKRKLQLGTESFDLHQSDPLDSALAARMCIMRLARVELTSRMWELSNLNKIPISRVTIRNQRARWGSCSRSGAISLNWKLVQTPEAVRDYVMIHELMHRKQFNHSQAFWQLVAEACPDYLQHREWIHQHWRILSQ